MIHELYANLSELLKDEVTDLHITKSPMHIGNVVGVQFKTLDGETYRLSRGVNLEGADATTGADFLAALIRHCVKPTADEIMEVKN